ncbi:MAG: hypothetical protein J6U43_00565 [Bacteroidales bacterium]|nr:hypothetical protein [Bacteroidales bacterium]
MENQIFSLKRFGLYFGKYLSEYRSLQLQFLILAGTFTAIMCLTGGELSFYGAITPAMFIFAIVSASRMSSMFTPRVNKIRFLLTPVSQLEKLLAMVLHLYIIIPLMFVVLIFVAQYCAMFITALFTLSWPHFQWPYAGIDFDASYLGLYALSYVGGTAFYLMGATLFTRHTFLKTTGLALVLGFVFSALMSVAIGMHAFSVGAFTDFENFNTVNDLGGNFLIVMSVIVTILYLGVAYLRISEMEVNETKK